MATPNSMPKRTNPLHQQILSGLLATKPVKSTFKRLVKGADGKEDVATRVSVRPGIRFPLAENVSVDSIERMGRRWL